MGMRVTKGSPIQGFVIDDVVKFTANEWVNIQHFLALRVVDSTKSTECILKDTQDVTSELTSLPYGVTLFNVKYKEIHFTEDQTLQVMYV